MSETLRSTEAEPALGPASRSLPASGARTLDPAPRIASHLPEYLAEALGLGLFMISACGFATLLWHPQSPLAGAIPDPMTRRVMMGIAMGLTAVGLIYSPWGRRSGAHMNPAVTLAFLRLGRTAPRDARAYVAAQIAGGVAGVLLMKVLLGRWLADPAVNYVVTVPGPRGAGVAFAAELAISLLMMLVVLTVSSSRLARFTGVAAGIVVASWITFEAPLSGMSMNPARSFGSALVAANWTAWWVYWIAPPLGMLLATEIHRRRATRSSRPAANCAKLHHADGVRCIFCEWRAMLGNLPAGDGIPAGDRETRVNGRTTGKEIVS